MRWEKPSFVEIRMDAEIGSYQDDFDSPDAQALQTVQVRTEPETDGLQTNRAS